MNWYLLVVSMPTDAGALRMRLWRNIKSLGAAVLRDGVYLLPALPVCLEPLRSMASEVNAAPGGSAYQLEIVGAEVDQFSALFDRSEQFKALLEELEREIHSVRGSSSLPSEKSVKKFRKAYSALAEIDFFPDAQIRHHVESVLDDLELAIRRRLYPDEPTATGGELAPLERHDFQGRLWATRERPWVDRLASAWLIRRYIDNEARFFWFASPSDCPSDAVGFDFDGAMFSHVGNKVTFETLTTRFGLENQALKRFSNMVHYLDVGGIEPPEAAGLERVLAGLREIHRDDDTLLNAACLIFDGLIAIFDKEANVHE